VTDFTYLQCFQEKIIGLYAFVGGDEMLSDETGGYVARMGNMEWETAWNK